MARPLPRGSGRTKRLTYQKSMPTAGWKKRWQMERPARMGYKLSGVECAVSCRAFSRARVYICVYVRTRARTQGSVIFDIWPACVGCQFIPLPRVKGGVWKSCVRGTAVSFETSLCILNVVDD